MAEEKPPMPAQPRTTELPAVDKQEILLAELKVLVTQGFSSMNTRMEKFEQNQDLQGGQIGVVEKEMSLLWQWKEGVDEKLKTNSVRAKGDSAHDLEVDAKMAEGLVWRRGVDDALARTATKDDLRLATDAQTTAIVTGVKEAVQGVFDAAAKSPTVRRLGQAAVALAFLAMSTATTYLLARGH